MTQYRPKRGQYTTTHKFGGKPTPHLGEIRSPSQPDAAVGVALVGPLRQGRYAAAHRELEAQIEARVALVLAPRQRSATAPASVGGLPRWAVRRPPAFLPALGVRRAGGLSLMGVSRRASSLCS